MLVDVLHRELHRGHDAAADVTLRHVIAVREEAGDVDVALLAAAEIDRLNSVPLYLIDYSTYSN